MVSEFFDKVIMNMMKYKKWRKIYDKSIEEYMPETNPLNSINLIRDFLTDLDLNEDFKEYCKMRFEMEESKDDS